MAPASIVGKTSRGATERRNAIGFALCPQRLQSALADVSKAGMIDLGSGERRQARHGVGLLTVAPPSLSSLFRGRHLPASVVRVDRDPLIWHQGSSNDCGPYSLATAADCVVPGSLSPVRALQLLRLLRLPIVGATPPWSIAIAARLAGFSVSGRFFGTIDDLRQALSRGKPCLVIVRPDEVARVKWYALHYRVVLGYSDDSSRPGGGEFYFACSATPSARPHREQPGNLTLDYATFQRQWRTWLIPRWYGVITTVSPHRQVP